MKRALHAAAFRLMAMASAILASGLLVSAFGVWLAGQIGTVLALAAMGCAVAVVAIVLGQISGRKAAIAPKVESAEVSRAVIRTLVAVLPRLGRRRGALAMSAALVAMAVVLIGSDCTEKRND